MSPVEQAIADQMRAAIKDALENHPYTCNECPSDEDLRAALLLADEDLILIGEFQ